MKAFSAAALMFAVFFSGCTYTHNIHVFMSPELKERYGYYPSLEVDIVGVNDSEKNWLSSYDINKYFEVGNPLRKSLSPLTMEFSESKSELQYMKRGSKLWKSWGNKAADEVYVMVNLPEAGEVKGDSRIVKFLMKSNIFKSHNKYIEIRPAGAMLVNEPPAGAVSTGRNADAL